MRCGSCLFYKNSKCLKMHDDTFESCKYYQVLQEKSTVAVTVQQLKDITNVCSTLCKDDISIRRDSSSELNTSVNVSREDLLIFLDNILDVSAQIDYSDIVLGFLNTLQSYMFIEAFKPSDERYAGGLCYAFLYPCGTRCLYIKITVKNNRIVVISFHSENRGLNSWLNQITKNIDSKLLSVDTLPQIIYLGELSFDVSAAFTRNGNNYIAILDTYKEVYIREFTASVVNMLGELNYTIQDISLKTVTQQQALALGLFPTGQLSNFGKLYTLNTMLHLFPVNTTVLNQVRALLSEDILNEISSIDADLGKKLNFLVGGEMDG